MRDWVYSASMNTSELQAVMTISPPRFSRTVLLNVLLLSRGEWLRRKIGVRGVRNLKKKNYHLPKSLHHQVHHKQDCGSKRPSLIYSHFIRLAFPVLVLWLCAKPSERSLQGTQFHVSLSGCWTHPLLTFANHNICRFFRDGLSSFDGKKKYMANFVHVLHNPFTPLIISVTCLRFLAPEVNASWSCRSDFLPVNAGVLIVTLNTHSTAARRTTITWCNAWHWSTTFTHSESWISACYHHSGCETPMYVCTSTTHTIKINWVNVQ